MPDETIGISLATWTADLERVLAAMPAVSETISAQQVSRIRGVIMGAAESLGGLAQCLDPIKLPGKVFNPSDPSVVGPFVGVALLAQRRKPLAEIGKFYGSGVYALYYRGDFEAYTPLRGTEHPIYVGKADPEDQKADTPQGQGAKLAGRLMEHAKNIHKARTTLRVEDFDCRYLVISSGWQVAAESFLIRLYDPIWNNETRICHGLGKHGDSNETRANKRSPWDTMHPGRAWAAHAPAGDQYSEAEIRENLRLHFSQHPPLETPEKAFEKFLEVLR